MSYVVKFIFFTILNILVKHGKNCELSAESDNKDR